jgi:anti-anti-sigma regulatory factor
MTPDVLEGGCHWAWQSYYSIPSIVRRIFKPGDKLLEMATNLYFNWAYRRMVNRLPQGVLTPLGKIFDRLQEEILLSGKDENSAMPARVSGLQIQVSRDYLRFKNTVEVHLAGVLNDSTAYPLKERINTLVRATGSDLMVHFGGLTMVVPHAVQRLLEGTRRAFEEQQVQLFLQGVDASLLAWLRQISTSSFATVVAANPEATAAGD